MPIESHMVYQYKKLGVIKAGKRGCQQKPKEFQKYWVSFLAPMKYQERLKLCGRLDRSNEDVSCQYLNIGQNKYMFRISLFSQWCQKLC